MLTLREEKQVPLTHEEMDNNFKYLLEKIESLEEAVFIGDAVGSDEPPVGNEPPVER